MTIREIQEEIIEEFEFLGDWEDELPQARLCRWQLFFARRPKITGKAASQPNRSAYEYWRGRDEILKDVYLLEPISFTR